MQADLEAKFQQASGAAQKVEHVVNALRGEMDQLREMMVITAKEATTFALAPMKATLPKTEKEVTETAGARTSMGLKISEMESQVEMVIDRVGDTLFQSMADVEQAQERLMHVVENITTKQNASQDEEVENKATPFLIPIADIVTSQK